MDKEIFDYLERKFNDVNEQFTAVRKTLGEVDTDLKLQKKDNEQLKADFLELKGRIEKIENRNYEWLKYFITAAVGFMLALALFYMGKVTPPAKANVLPFKYVPICQNTRLTRVTSDTQIGRGV